MLNEAAYIKSSGTVHFTGHQKPSMNKVPWWSKQVKAAINRKQKAFQRHKATASQADCAFYKFVGIKLHCARSNYESQLIANRHVQSFQPKSFTPSVITWWGRENQIFNQVFIKNV